jgi:phage recombination protein Bet
MTENLPQLTDEYCLKEFGWTKNRFEVIQRTYFKGLSMDDIAVFGHVCKHVGLDPFLKQIYPVIRNVKQKDGTSKPTMSIQTGIDGYRAVAERTGKYSPGKEPLFKYENLTDGSRRLFSATAYVMKMTNDGKWHEVAATAILTEYRPAFQNDFWATKPHIMLSKCAEALSLRKAFPAELSSIYTKEEMDQADKEEKLEQAECEDITQNKKEECEKLTHDTKMDHFKPDTNLNQEQEISSEQLNVLMIDYAKTSNDFKINFDKYMNEVWKVKEFENIPAKHFNSAMISIKRNLEMQAMAVQQ